jgi:carbon starvation protein
MLTLLFLCAVVFFVLAFKFYGRFMSNVFKLDNTRKPPSETLYDGIDYCPAHPAVLTGHHFSSIAGAGPIVGPITAATMFGWLPAYLWCVIGSAFLGGPHDTGSLVSSIRHGGKSTGVVIKRWIGDRGAFLFLCFSILTLILVVAVFLQLSAVNMAADPAVAFAAMVYMGLAVIFGLMVYRFGISLKLSTLVMLPFVFGACWFAQSNPEFAATFKLSMETWRWILVGYIIVASLLPVWLLLQPRDYLASYFLYFAVIIGAIGMLFGAGQFEVVLPAFKTLSAGASGNQYLWPMLFVVVACGAISGFHSMVGSGTSSKQLRKETDSLIVGYGSMLLEGMVAVIAIGTIMIAPSDGALSPMIVYSQGFGKFASLIGINPALGATLGLFAINTFLLTSLDTATRLTRYQIQEISGNKLDKYIATLLAVAGALILVHSKSGANVPIATMIWPIFGSANQLVAALALLAIAVWVKKDLKARNDWLMYPMWFMLFTTVAALILLIRDQLMAASANYVLVVLSVVLMGLAILMVREALMAIKSDESGLKQPLPQGEKP